MADLCSLRATVSGHVQGVLFRDFILRLASSLDLTGYVRNLPDGQTIEIMAEGNREKLETLVDYIKVGPPNARVEKVEVSRADLTGNYSDFKIRY